MSEKSCRLSFGTVRTTDFRFADDGIILAKSSGILAGGLNSLREEDCPLGLRMFWIKTKVKAFVVILDATVESNPVSGNKVEVTQTVTTLAA